MTNGLLGCIILLLEKLTEVAIGAQLKIVERGFNRKQAHELNKPIKMIAKESEAIVEKLLALTNSKDEKVSADACKTLLSYLERFTAQRDADEMQRLIANIKFNGPKQLEAEDDTPLVDFNNLQDVN